MTHEPQSESIAIPGCSEVIPLDEQERINVAFPGGGIGGGFDGGGGTFGGFVDVPWATPAGAEAMSAALRSALPPGAVIEPSDVGADLSFPPFTVDVDGSSFGAVASAAGIVAVDGQSGVLTVDVELADAPPGPCFAGQIDERVDRADGIVVDVVERGSSRRATVHAPDGFQVDVNAGDFLTLDQVVNIALIPALRAVDPA
ncbi:hypothetical protein HQ339_21870 [Rhodococcus sp. BP-370]|nr:hypothetical protein [Rhodococcus sp. BP-370]